VSIGFLLKRSAGTDEPSRPEEPGRAPPAAGHG
jgi:hypothetical protein